MSTDIVFIHGLQGEKYVPAFWDAVIAALPAHYTAHIPTYNSHSAIEDSVTSIAHFLQQKEIQHCQCVGHSLGALIAAQVLNTHSSLRCDHCLLIFPPWHGSRLARCAQRLPFSSYLFGAAVNDIARMTGSPDIPTKSTVGVIRGTQRIRWQRPETLLTQPFLLPSANDGFLRLEETAVEDADEQIYLYENHMVFPNSKNMVNAIVQFLQQGTFRNRIKDKEEGH